MLNADKEAFLLLPTPPSSHAVPGTVCLCGVCTKQLGKVSGRMRRVMQAFVQAFVPYHTPAAIAADCKHLHKLTKEIPSSSLLPFSLIYYTKEITLTCPCSPPPLSPLTLCSQVCLLFSVWKILQECGGSGCFLQ